MVWPSQIFWTLKETIFKTLNTYFYFSLHGTLNETFMATYGLLMMAFSPEHLKWDQNLKCMALTKTNANHPPPPGLILLALHSSIAGKVQKVNFEKEKR